MVDSIDAALRFVHERDRGDLDVDINRDILWSTLTLLSLPPLRDQLKSILQSD